MRNAGFKLQKSRTGRERSLISTFVAEFFLPILLAFLLSIEWSRRQEPQKPQKTKDPVTQKQRLDKKQRRKECLMS